jgi:hypothetical protein
MTKFEELQAAHEHLMEQSKAPANVDAFVIDVQHGIQQMCVAAEDVPAPRERDQLRAILRFWASYVYDHTGTYPDTTLRPAISREPKGPSRLGGVEVLADSVTITEDAVGRDKIASSSSELSRARSPLFWIAVAAGAVFIVLLAVVYFVSKSPGMAPVAVPTPDATEQVTTARPSPVQPEIQGNVITSGPSPFDAKVWVVKLQLSATGGDGNYIFWVNGVRLPDISNNQFTVEGKDCDPQKPVVGVTSGGQATSLELTIFSPLPGCPQP